MSATTLVRLHVDPDKCQGHNRCKAIAPDLFVLDDFGNAREAGDGVVPPGQADKARLARANCPEYAIRLTTESAP
ncbi:MAG: ferredoxin [Acetobacteraceae bacterium]